MDAARNRHKARPVIATVIRVERLRHIGEVDVGITLPVRVVCLNTNRGPMDADLPGKLRVWGQITGFCMAGESLPIIQKAAREGGLKLMRR